MGFAPAPAPGTQPPIDAAAPIRQGRAVDFGVGVAAISKRSMGLRVHRWLALAIGLFALAMALSGTILATGAASPARVRASGTARIAPVRYVDAAHRRLQPGERIAALAMGDGSSPVVVTLDRTRDRSRRMVFLDPPTGAILASGRPDSMVLGTMRRFHDGLFLSGRGRWVIGLIGAGMLSASLTGLWAQTTRQPPRRRKRRTHKGEAALAWHRRVGLWAALPVLAMTVSGMALAFSDSPTDQSPAPPLARPALSVERVIASGRAWSRGRLTAIDWPTERSPDWTLHYAGHGPIIVKVADDSVDAVAAPGHADPTMLSWVQRLHGGRGMGWPWRTLAVVIGLLTIWSTVSGLAAYRVRPKLRRARR